MENVPVGGQGAPSMNHNGRTPAGGRGNAKTKNNKLKIIAAIATVLVLLGILLGGWTLYRSSTAAHIDDDKYQAVFFTNGQVYFGKLQKLNNSYFKLTNVYYLQAKSSTQNTEETSENPQETAGSAEDIQLVKLGNEVHGPDDEMIISKEQILFFENLKKDGKVSDSINKHSGQ